MELRLQLTEKDLDDKYYLILVQQGIIDKEYSQAYLLDLSLELALLLDLNQAGFSKKAE